MARKPKVFAARVGFFDTVVAAASQKAALEAWGAERNWFAEGLAAPTDEAKALQAATDSPGVVLRRPAGSDAAYAREAAAAAPPGLAITNRKKGKTGKVAPATKPPPDRSRLDAAESALADFEREREHVRRDLRQRREALEAEAKAAEADLRARERTLAKALEKARAAYARAGGAP